MEESQHEGSGRHCSPDCSEMGEVFGLRSRHSGTTAFPRGSEAPDVGSNALLKPRFKTTRRELSLPHSTERVPRSSIQRKSGAVKILRQNVPHTAELSSKVVGHLDPVASERLNLFPKPRRGLCLKPSRRTIRILVGDGRQSVLHGIVVHVFEPRKVTLRVR